MRDRLRQLLLGIVVLAYLMAGHGLLPSASMLARWSPLRERFPCEDCACGCASAHDCWANCCCHSAAQRLAWAREHGVTPPIDAVAMLEREAADSCPMCEAEAEHPAGPAMSALACRGIAGWVVFAPPNSWRLPGESLLEPRPAPGRVSLDHSTPVQSPGLDVETPPPRRA